MKRIFVLLTLGLFIGNSFGQACLNNVWMCLSNEQIPKARNEIDKCMVGNENSAEAWLFKGNVYLRTANQDRQRRDKDPKYVSRVPDAIWIAYESFVKSIELELASGTTLEIRQGIIDAKKGQVYCAIPLYNSGIKAADDKNQDLAYKYLTAAVKCFKLDKSNPDVKVFLGYAYYYLADIYVATDKKDDYKKVLKEAVNEKVTLPQIYFRAYDLYRSENDTVECGKLISAAKTIVPDSLLYTKELDYFSMTKQQDKIDALIDTLTTKYSNNPTILNDAASELIYNGLFEKARGIIEMGLKVAPNDFNLTKRMGYLYAVEADNYQQEIEDGLKNKMNFNEIKKLQDLKKETLDKAFPWLEKAYQINGNDRENNIMLQRIMLVTGQPVPDDLKEKVDSYKKSE